MAEKTARCTCPSDSRLVFLGHLRDCPEVATTSDDLRSRYAEAIHYVLYGPHRGDTTQRLAATAAHAVLAVRDEELERLRDLLDTQQHADAPRTVAAWGHYAKRWRERAEQAVAAIARAKALHSRDDSNPHGPWCGTCTTHWPCRTWIALLPSATTTEEIPNV